MLENYRKARILKQDATKFEVALRYKHFDLRALEGGHGAHALAHAGGLVCRAALPFMGLMLAVLMLITYVPELSLYLIR